MDAKNLIAWYQNKIGYYDEQVWEKQIEHKKYYAFSPVDLKSTNLKPGLIDLDLVRGSSFTKAKPKHGLLTVLKLATIRILFLPFHIKWWRLQTSNKVTFFLFLVYLMQILNIYLYYYHIDKNLDNVEMSGLIFVPLFMMWMLCLIHSQIVATNPGPDETPLKAKSHKNLKKKACKFNLIMKNNGVLKASQSVIDQGFESFNGNGTSNSDNDLSTLNKQTCNVGETIRNNNECKRKNLIASRQNKKSQCHSTSTDEEGSNSDTDITNKPKIMFKKRNSYIRELFYDMSDEDDYSNTCSKRSSPNRILSTVECLGATTNSEEECSYASDLDNFNNQCDSLFDGVPSCINASEKVSCLIWHATDIKEASLSALDIISAIIARVESVPENMDYFYFGVCLSTLISLAPALCRFFSSTIDIGFSGEESLLTTDIFSKVATKFSELIVLIFNVSFGATFLERVIIINAAIQRWILSFLFFFLLSVAERTYKQRFLYVKFFSHLTSSRRARKSELPHFRLNKVLNIKIWLTTRSYLKKKGPQRSVDIIVSAAFIIAFLLFLFISVDILPCNLEAIIWCLGLGVWLLRFMTLGTQINRKYVNRNLSILTTEQINLHLQIEQNSGKKEELTIANNVLKLAADLLKDMESPFQILGLSANPYLYAIIKLVMLSALSGVLSDLLGFKLKLHKIKVK